MYCMWYEANGSCLHELSPHQNIFLINFGLLHYAYGTDLILDGDSLFSLGLLHIR